MGPVQAFDQVQLPDDVFGSEPSADNARQMGSMRAPMQQVRTLSSGTCSPVLCHAFYMGNGPALAQ